MLSLFIKQPYDHMKNIFLITLFFAGLLNGIAQSDSTSRVRKNEFGLSIQPLVILLMDADPNLVETGFSYKRLISNKWYLRFTTGYSEGENNFGIASPWNDSILQMEQFQEDFYSISQRIGLEKRKLIRNKVSLFYGADLMAGIKRKKSKEGVVYQEYDFDNNGIRSVNLYKDTLYSKRTVNSFNIGLGFNIGFIVPIGKRFFTSAEMRSNFCWMNSKYTEENMLTSKISRNSTRSLDFELTHPIYNLTLGIKI